MNNDDDGNDDLMKKFKNEPIDQQYLNLLKQQELKEQQKQLIVQSKQQHVPTSLDEIDNYTQQQYQLDIKELTKFFKPGCMYFFHQSTVKTVMFLNLGEYSTCFSKTRYQIISDANCDNINQTHHIQVDVIPSKFLLNGETATIPVELYVEPIIRPNRWSQEMTLIPKRHMAVAPNSFKQSYQRNSINNSFTRYEFTLRLFEKII
jgi:hypothetical protein